MKIRQILLSTVLSGACAATVAHAGVRIGIGELNLDATAEYAQVDRVFPEAGSRSDTNYRFTPGMRYSRESPRLDLNAGLSTSFSRYDSVNALDSTDINAFLRGTIPYVTGPRFSGNWNVTYFNGIDSDYLTNRNLETDRFNADLTSFYRVGRRIDLRGRVGYSDRSSEDVFSTFRNSNRTTLGAVGVHGRELFGRIGAFVEYRAQKRKTTGGNFFNSNVDQTDSGLNFGIDGQILPERLFPNLDAELSFGWANTSRLSQEGGRSNRFILNGRLAYPVTPMANAQLIFSRNLLVTDDDRTVERTDVRLGLVYNPANDWSGSASVGYRKNDFIVLGTGRTDNIFLLETRVNYQIRQNWSASVFYNLRDASSNSFINDFSSARYGILTTITY